MEEDLPLLSNVSDVLVSHYIFNFDCSFQTKSFNCYVILFLNPVTNDSNANCSCLNSPTTFCESFDSSRPAPSSQEQYPFSTNLCSASKDAGFVLILDCYKIIVNRVVALNLSHCELEKLKFSGGFVNLSNFNDSLSFLSSEWSLKIWSDKKTCKLCFPKTVMISYETLPSSSSLLWVKDQDGKSSVFTYGAMVNNRSLFPCQEPPIAMATWEATVSVSDSAVVLMSGDEEPIISYEEVGTRKYYYYTRKALPLSTLCLAIGVWEEHVISKKYDFSPKFRIFAPSSLIDVSIQELFEYVPYCLKILEDTLGPYPFPRIDFLIVPPTFGSLGMANPNVIFLSQSLLVGDGSLCSRVAHEIAHGWFGLLIGALDWTEEWLSEGFATFVEDYVHPLTINMKDMDAKDYRELRLLIRKKTLLDEVKNTDDELQVLRASKGLVDKNIVDGIDATILKNGQNPMKGFMQVHYLKGYFLLKYLSDSVGAQSFMNFLCEYVKQFAGKLVTSKDFLTMYFSYFSSIGEKLKLEDIIETWLHNPGIPEAISRTTVSPNNRLFKEVMCETEKWKKLNYKFLKKGIKRRKYNKDEENISHLSSEQIILLLENFLDMENFSAQILKYLNEVYCFEDLNSEVQHRWFELVVKHKYKSKYNGLRNFLTNHLAMGIYLYSEMIFSSSSCLRNIAEGCYNALKSEMEPNYKSTISKMLEDKDSVR